MLLQRSLPKPKYTGEDEELKGATGSRIVGAEHVDSQQLTLRRTGIPRYGERSRWRPRSAEDYGDGGAYPECPVVQYPLDMGRKGAASRSNALALKVDGEGKPMFDSIAKRGHGESRIVQASFKDLIPLRQRADAGELQLDRPDEATVEATRERTAAALGALVSSQTAAQRPKNVPGRAKDEPTFVKYTPTNQMGDNNAGKSRIFKIQQRQQDPMEPPKFKHKRIPRGPPSPPPPVMHSPPRKLTAEDQENWKIPPPISNWKNPKGYTVPLDKRLAADGRGLQDVTINDKFAQFAEALFTADRAAREEVKSRALMQQKLAEKEKLRKEEHLRELAQKARQERQGGPSGRRSESRRSDSRDSSPYSSASSAEDSDSSARKREELRRERRKEHERELRKSRMGTERRIQMMAREQNRDISEKVALGLAKPTSGGETMYDSRLFNQTSGFDTGFNEDQAYDKPLFAAQDAISSIYRPSVQAEEEGEDGGETYEKISKTSRFEVLGRAKEGFKGAEEAERREGPVVFEKDVEDPFRIGEMIEEVTGGAGGAGKKRYGMQEEEGEGREKKRARVEDE